MVLDYQAEEHFSVCVFFSSFLSSICLWIMDHANLMFSNSLAAVNFFLGLVGVIQVSRIVSYNMSHKDEPAKEDVEVCAGREAIDESNRPDDEGR